MCKYVYIHFEAADVYEAGILIAVH